MKKILIMPDSFKGTVSSMRICTIIRELAKKHFPLCEVVAVPIADGGEGSVDSFVEACRGELVSVTCKNPYFEQMESFYGIIDGGSTAVIEMASCAGLPLVSDRKNPSLTTTYGVGEIILDAAEKGVDKIIIGLGGSSTNDCGCGMAAALGVKFRNKEGGEFIPTGGTLKDIDSIDTSEISKKLCGIYITAMCDIENTLYGEEGAAYVFARQKGADDEKIRELDDGLKHVSSIIKRDLGVDVSDIQGGGAAGGMGAGVVAFLGGSLKSGIDVLLDTINFEEKLKGADLIFTGEGKFDAQSLMGKVIGGISARALKLKVPVIVVAGGVDDAQTLSAYQSGITASFSINRLPEDFEISKNKSEENIKNTVDNILRLIRSIKGL